MSFFIKLVISVLLGGLIGFERQSRGQYAGFRTQILVCLGSCLFTIVSIQSTTLSGNIADPGRIAAQIVTGIGFLGAGAILRQKELIRGLTTAATLWVVSAIGMTVGFGEYLIAGAATFVVLATLIIFKNMENAFFQTRYAHLQIVIKGVEEMDLKKLLKGKSIKILSSTLKLSMERGQIEQTFSLEYRDESQLRELFKVLKNDPNLMEFHIE